MDISAMSDSLSAWVAALEARHLANLRVPEVTRALRALSSAYVERRRHSATAAGGQRVLGALDSHGKRAAFALFYAPLHFIAVTEVIRSLGSGGDAPRTIVDLGCGTGSAGAAWALALRPSPDVLGIDRHPWAVEEAQWTYRQLGVRGRARQGDVTRLPRLRQGDAVVAAYVLNELPEASRTTLERRLLDAAASGSRVLVVEPISRRVVPWWDSTAARVIAGGGRADEWRIPLDLPPLLKTFDKAAGLNHSELTFRSLLIGGQGYS
jgi:hypothetical protein